MKALISEAVGGPETLRLGELPDPVVGPGQVAIAVEACAINYPDVLIIEDLYQMKPARPFAPGGEVAGIVQAVGAGVSSLSVGDRVIAVCGHGGLAECVVVGEGMAFAIPDAMDYATGAALLMTYGTSLHALVDRGRLHEGETLLVLGAAGGVGLAAIELAKAMGARVVGAVSSEAKAEAVRRAGADEAVIYPADVTDTAASKALAEQFKAAVGPGGADVIYDAVGGAYCEPALRAIAWGGRYLVVGFPAGIPRPPLNLALLKGCDIAGVFWGAFAMRDPQANRAHVARLMQLWEAGRIRPLVTHRYPLADGGAAIAALASRSTFGKLVVEVTR